VRESFDHRPPRWIRQSRKCCSQSIHNQMVVDFRLLSSIIFAIPNFSSLPPLIHASPSAVSSRLGRSPSTPHPHLFSIPSQHPRCPLHSQLHREWVGDHKTQLNMPGAPSSPHLSPCSKSGKPRTSIGHLPCNNGAVSASSNQDPPSAPRFAPMQSARSNTGYFGIADDTTATVKA
jgi:hypothetical protein